MSADPDPRPETSSPEGASPLEHAGDPGLFGPGSVTWRVHSDPSMIVGGLRSLFLQALHPAAIAGVMEHSGFRADPWGRLFRTAEFVGVCSYGPRAEVEAAAARVRRVHAPLRGVVPSTGLPYRVSDPHLLRWVHVSEVSSFVAVAHRSGLALTDAELDSYLGEQVAGAALVGARAGVPASRAELVECFRSYLPELSATDQACSAAEFVLAPPIPVPAAVVLPLRVSWGSLAALAFASLPLWARTLYRDGGLQPDLRSLAPWRLPPLPGARVLPRLALGLGTPSPLRDTSREALLTLALTSTFTPLRALPATLREGPHLRSARARLATTPES